MSWRCKTDSGRAIWPRMSHAVTWLQTWALENWSWCSSVSVSSHALKCDWRHCIETDSDHHADPGPGSVPRLRSPAPPCLFRNFPFPRLSSVAMALWLYSGMWPSHRQNGGSIASLRPWPCHLCHEVRHWPLMSLTSVTIGVWVTICHSHDFPILGISWDDWLKFFNDGQWQWHGLSWTSNMIPHSRLPAGKKPRKPRMEKQKQSWPARKNKIVNNKQWTSPT